jgi:hypothetical protein
MTLDPKSAAMTPREQEIRGFMKRMGIWDVSLSDAEYLLKALDACRAELARATEIFRRSVPNGIRHSR